MRGFALRRAAVALTVVMLAAVCVHGASRERPQKKAGAFQADRVPADLAVVKSIVFKKVGDKALDLCLFPPAGKEGLAPAVVYIHGGGWGGGDKWRVLRRDIIAVVRESVKNGVACVSIEYRLSDRESGATTYDSEVDCKDALRFLAKHGAEYRIDASRIGLIGSSAGGHLAVLTALSDDKDFPGDPLLQGPVPAIRCAAGYYGLYFFTRPEMLKGSNFEKPERLVPILGGPLSEKMDLAKKLSPIEHLGKDGPPILMVHGDSDKTLSVEQAKIMKAAADEKGGSAELLIVKGAGHGLQGDPIEPPLDEVTSRTAAFFLRRL